MGLGCSVCGGIQPSEDQILIDMSAMNRILEIDEKNLLLKVEAGISGLIAEEAVASQGVNNRSLATINLYQLSRRLGVDASFWPIFDSIWEHRRHYLFD